MGLPAARVGDPHLCPMFDGPKPHVGGPVLPLGAVPNVWVGGMMAATVGTMCTCASAPDSIMMGSPTVYIGGRMAARMLDPTVHGGRIIFGCLNVWIGDSGAPSSLAAFFNGLLDGLFDGLKAIVEPLMWFTEGVIQGFVSALMGTISGIVNLAKEILTDPLKVLERTANFLQKLNPVYWIAKLATDPQMRAALGQWLSDQTKKETWEHYGDVAKKAYNAWEQLTPKEKWTAAGDVTGRALEFAAEIVVLDGATKAVGAAGEVAKGEEAIAGLGELGVAADAGTVAKAEELAEITNRGIQRTAEDVNAQFIEENLAKGKPLEEIKPPWQTGNKVVEYTTNSEEKFVRVHTQNNPQGGWMMKEKDLYHSNGQRLTSEEIKDKFALPETPTHISEVNVPANFKIRTGVASEVPEWGAGGGQQYQAIDRVSKDMITNTKPLN